METTPLTTSEMPDLEALGSILQNSTESDPLLERVVDRLRREQGASAEDFFKHGQFGSHNSGH